MSNVAKALLVFYVPVWIFFMGANRANDLVRWEELQCDGDIPAAQMMWSAIPFLWPFMAVETKFFKHGWANPFYFPSDCR